MMIGRKKASDLKAPAASTASNIVKGPAADVPFRPEVEGDDGVWGFRATSYHSGHE